MAEATNPIITASNPRVGEDWVLVPREPTSKMVAATWNDPVDAKGGIESQNARNKRIYRAMIASAPSPEAGAGGDLGELERLSKAAPFPIHLRRDCLEVQTEAHRTNNAYLGREMAEYVFALVTAHRSGKLVASTGSGEETKGEPSGTGSREPGPTVPACGFDPSRAALRALRIGDMVRVNQSLDQPWTFDWQDGPYEVIGLALDRHGDPTVTLSHDGDVGSDGFDPSDLVLVAPCDGSAEGGETGTGSTEGNSAVREAEAPEATPQSSPSQTPVDPQMTVDPWQLITTAPRNGTLVEIKGTYLGGGDWESKGWFETSPADRCWYDAADDEPCRPTHWRPIARSDAPSTTEADR